MGCAVAGIWFRLGYTGGVRPVLPVVCFYVVASGTLLLLLRYLVKIWKSE